MVLPKRNSSRVPGPGATSSSEAMRRPRPAGRVVAVTGASSFLGNNLVGLLEEDPGIARIVAVDIRAPLTGGRKTRYYEVDFTQPTAEARLSEIFSAEAVETLVHLAFLASPSHKAALAHELESVGTDRKSTRLNSSH